MRGVTTTTLHSPSGRSGPRHDPAQELLTSAAEQHRDWKYEHPTGGEIVGWWIDLRNGSRPPGPEIAKQGAAAKRLAEKHPRGAIIRALIGIGQLFPHSTGEPYDLFDVERKFAKAHDAFEQHPAVRHALADLGGLLTGHELYQRDPIRARQLFFEVYEIRVLEEAAAIPLLEAPAGPALLTGGSDG